MSTITVRSQAELDAALLAADAETEWTDIVIRSDAGVWLRLDRTPDSSSVVARDSSSVVAWGSSSVVARGSSRVVARDSSRVVAWGSSRVVAWDSSRVEARGGSSVVARDSSSVVARDSSRVVARDSSRVVAWGSSRVEAGDSSRVVAGDYVAVHVHSARATIEGGVLIDVTNLDENDVAQWAAYHGAKSSEGSLVLYKAVDADLESERGFAYPIGETVEAPDWRADNTCGGGLHLSPSPSCARQYFPSATRFLRCEVDPADVRPIPGDVAKAKAHRVRVVAEVNIHGDEVAS